ncbi:MAG: Uma2 family endonuclease [Methylococcales bacterium]|nr:Uma2 family endonuclease [Methylococcales bacterium]
MKKTKEVFMAASLHNDVKQNSYISPVVLHWPLSMRVVNDQFFEFCQANKELRIERTAQGDCEIMAPTGGETGWRNSRLTAQLYNWAEREGSGVVFDSSSGFVLPNGAIRSPDVSWVKRTRLAVLTPEQKQRFLPLCPDFVIELRSASDNLKALQDKIQEYIENGASLGWLIDTEAKQVLVFQPQKKPFSIEKPEVMSADEILIELDMQKIWDVEF